MAAYRQIAERGFEGMTIQAVADAVRAGVAEGASPQTVANSILDALGSGRFWVLPQPEVAIGALDRVQRILDGRDPVDLLS